MSSTKVKVKVKLCTGIHTIFLIDPLSDAGYRRVDDDEGEYRPLLPKTDRESVLRGEDYWIDYREVSWKTNVPFVRRPLSIET